MDDIESELLAIQDAMDIAFKAFCNQGDYSHEQKRDAYAVLQACPTMSGQDVIDKFGNSQSLLNTEEVVQLVGLYVWSFKGRP
ncbi:hypothetical protein [Solemya velum gill symbiont]|uniref:hypothetical protein n=1 Tax=Solemya velum gill symbiont TaxID=2340 RepID=UPI00117B4FC6|nr:hypothetical protein [Solemya velum gill symbiont]